MRIGLISDTHNLLRPEALEFLKGCDHILHGGDIGDESILERLAELAPLSVVRGNNDKDSWAQRLPHSLRLQFEQVSIHAVHDIAELDVDPVAAGVQVVVTGHSHKPLVRERDGVVYVNPGSAGRRRFSLPIALGELIIRGSQVTPRIVELTPG